MDITTLRALEAPFPQTQIRQRPGNHGAVLDYVEGHAVVQRLNHVFNGDWGFEILIHQIQDQANEVIVLGRLTAGTVTKTQFGSSAITTTREGKPVSLGSDLKAAATDALKKCATLLGVGLYLYKEGSKDRDAE